MRGKIHIVAFLLGAFLSLEVIAQAQLPPIPDMRTCATMEQDSINRLKYPGWGSLDQLEIAIQQKIGEIEKKRAAGRIEAVVTIPVIFHIVHDGEPVGSGRNVSEERVQAQIEVLNEDFRRMAGTNGFNTDPNGADIEIEFCLASLDEDGNPLLVPGIERIDGGQDGWTRQEIEGQLKPLTIWNPNLYYNVWVVDFEGEDELLLGYAQFPSESGLAGLPGSGGPASTDGVVLRHDVVGSAEKGNFPTMQAPYNLGRTFTHETGHWLGLRHIWGDGACNADDFCADTPIASGPHRGCPIGTASCGTTDMIENYMDYTNDACMNIFTNDQKARILAVMELSPRRGILTSSTVCGVANQDPPVANFTADKTSVLLGGTVKFTDLSTNFPTDWTWTFEGGNPSVSTERNPTVTYETPGDYKVSLISTNANGSSPLFEVDDFISVSAEGLCNTLSNFGMGTETILEVPQMGDSSGYVSGHNSMMDMAKSELFTNNLGYVELSGALVKFGYAFSEDDEATAKIVVWNARGPQNGPGAELESKEILIKQIKEDIAANRATEVNFDRRVPIFLGTNFHIGLELSYDGDTLVLATTADGENTNQTSWEKNSEGDWIPYSLAWGYDVSHDITALVGMNPSVHVAPSALSVFAGQQVTLTGSGASIFNWNSDDGKVVNQLGQQIVVDPRQTTTYTVTGSGLDLCREEVSVTIYIKDSPLSLSEEFDLEMNLFPNPADDHLKITLSGAAHGQGRISIINSVGVAVLTESIQKDSESLIHQLRTTDLNSGVYIVTVEFDQTVTRKRIVIR